MSTSEAIAAEVSERQVPGRAHPGWIFTGLALTLSLLALYGPGFISSLWPPAGTIMDFYKEWSSVRSFLTGRSVYASQRETIREYLGNDIRARSSVEFTFVKDGKRYLKNPSRTAVEEGASFTFWEEYNTHPPTSVLLTLPFGFHSYPDAQFLWNLAGIGLFLLSLGLLVHELRITVPIWGAATSIGLLMICDPFRQTINQGQINFVMLFLVTLAWIGDRRGHAWCTGFCVALATCLKLYPGLFFVMFAARRDWRTVAWGVATGIAITLVTAAVLGPQAYIDWLGKPFAALKPFTNEWGNTSLLAFWQRLFGPARESIVPLFDREVLATLLTGLCAVIVVAALGRMAWRADSRDERDFAFAATATAMLFLTPIAWQHYFVILAMPLILLAARLEHGTPGRCVFLIALAVLWLSPRLAWIVADLMDPEGVPLGSASPWQSVTALSLQFYAILAVFVLLVIAAARVRQRAPSEASFR